MSDSAAAIDRLRRVAQRLTGMNDPDTEWLVSAIRQYEAGARFGVLLDDALELRASRGQTSWWEEEANALRDDLIRHIASRYFGSLSQRAAAEAIVRKARLYETSGWRRHRAFIAPPEAIQGSLRGDLFYLLKTHAPVSEAIARRALGSPCRFLVSHESADDATATDEETHGPTDDEVQTNPRSGGNPTTHA
jgi:hypothetical protein